MNEVPMCLTVEALVVFLNLLPPDIVTTGADMITVHAQTGDTVWEADGDIWCLRPSEGRVSQAG